MKLFTWLKLNVVYWPLVAPVPVFSLLRYCQWAQVMLV